MKTIKVISVSIWNLLTDTELKRVKREIVKADEVLHNLINS